MSWRRIPPIIASSTAAALASGACRRVTPEFRASMRDAVARYCDGRVAVLTDGATSALAYALRIAVPPGRAVALPGFGCVDLVAAASFANVTVLTYDIDPATLNPDLDSVRRAIAAGAGALVIAPLFGFPIDVEGLRSITVPAGVPVIEDAAQGAGGTWHERHLGSFGDVAVLSFGRGKGTSAGRGGALVSRHEDYDASVHDLSSKLSEGEAGWRDWMISVAVWALARPTLYAIPSSIPSLRLGEMVFHEAHEPIAMTDRAVAMLPAALRQVSSAAAKRGAVAAQLQTRLLGSTGSRLPTPMNGGRCGWLRLPLLDEAGRGPSATLGILRSYPLPIRAMPEGRSLLVRNPAPEPGADLLARTLLTVPTHRFVTNDVIDRIGVWAAAAV
jgi:dTDP-4-amino-4,6-dideoxygalactose transaminase